MKKFTLTLLATAALAVPALAQQQPAGNAPAGTTSQQQPMNTAQGGMISPRSLHRQQIRQIQQSLNSKGFSVGRADGVWNRRTRTALQDFQRKQGMQASGSLDQRTLSGLGVNIAQTNQPGMNVGRSVSPAHRSTRRPTQNNSSPQPQQPQGQMNAPATNPSGSQ